MSFVLSIVSLSKENNLPIIVFNMNKKGNLFKIISGEKIGSIVKYLLVEEIEFIIEVCEESMKNAIRHLEKELLNRSTELDRVHHFGNNRAIFNSQKVSLLVSNVDDSDFVILLINTLESSVTAIENKIEFIEAILQFKENNYQLKVELATIVDDLSTEIKDEIFDLAVKAGVSEQEEDRFIKTVERYQSQMENLFSAGLLEEERMTEVVNKAMNIEKEEDEIELF